jgi:hypothetical protein
LKAAISTFNHQFGVEGYSDVADPGPGKSAPPPSDGGQTKAAPQPLAPPATRPQAKAPAPPKPHKVPAKAETDASEENRPSQLNQIRAAMADAPTKPAPAAGPDNGEPKPKPTPRKRKAE